VRALPRLQPGVTGIDGCPAGWVAVTLRMPGPAAGPPDAPAGVTGRVPARVTVAVAAVLDRLPLTAVTGIDMPLGLLAAGWRDADQLARQALGRRGASVFAIPPRPVWDAATYAEANRACRELTGKGLSAQAWGLRRKIAEATEFRRRAAAQSPGLAPGQPVALYEVHPELSFAALAGGPLADSKHTPAGRARRRELLAEAGIVLPARVAGAAEHDLLDAAAVAWSARRIAAGQAAVLTNPAQRADDDTEIAVRY
jgi:predicted RNase H-like nuclease